MSEQKSKEEPKKMSDEAVSTNPYSRLMALQKMGVVENYEKIREFGEAKEKTIISREYSDTWVQGKEPYYPINNDRNNNLYKQYEELAKQDSKVIFGGRLGQYKYYDMDKVILEALNCVKAELN